MNPPARFAERLAEAGTDGDVVRAQTDWDRARLRVLHVVLELDETTPVYHEHCLPVVGERELSVCTFFRPGLRASTEITVYGGDDTVVGFLKLLTRVLRTQPFEIIHAHSPHVGVLLLVARMIVGAEQVGARLVYTVHNCFENYRLRNRVFLFPIFAWFDRVLCCGRSSFESMPSPARWLSGARLGAVANGVDLGDIDRATVDGRFGTANRPFTLVSVGRLVPIKNTLMAVEAFRQLADQGSRLVVIGEGPLRQPLGRQIEAGGLGDQVRLTGVISREAVYRTLANADLFISPSKGEGLPIAVLQAMACRCVVVLSDIGPHREIADGAEFIPLVDPDDTEGWVREIARVKAMSPAERAAVGERCRRIVEDRFDIRQMHARLEDLYRAPNPLAGPPSGAASGPATG